MNRMPLPGDQDLSGDADPVGAFCQRAAPEFVGRRITGLAPVVLQGRPGIVVDFDDGHGMFIQASGGALALVHKRQLTPQPGDGQQMTPPVNDLPDGRDPVQTFRVGPDRGRVFLLGASSKQGPLSAMDKIEGTNIGAVTIESRAGTPLEVNVWQSPDGATLFRVRYDGPAPVNHHDERTP